MWSTLTSYKTISSVPPSIPGATEVNVFVKYKRPSAVSVYTFRNAGGLVIVFDTGFKILLFDVLCLIPSELDVILILICFLSKILVTLNVH